MKNVTKKNFGAIIRRTIQGHGCAFLLHAVQFSEKLDEPSWRAATSIGKFCEDADDDKFLAAALAGRAGWIVTNDRHLLKHDPYHDIRIVRCGAFTDRVLNR